ncbi:MAG: type II secretion system F family protein [Acidimicrobiales bacterium]
MSLLVALMAGLVFGVGLVLIALGLRGAEVNPAADDSVASVLSRVRDIDQIRLRVTLAILFAFLMWILAAWPVAILLAAVGGAATPTIMGAGKRRDAAVAKTEAVATWAEQLRDTIGSSAGLQEAIVVTSRLAPAQIRAQVRELALGMRRSPLSVVLRRFAEAVDDPSADQVAVALILASERRGQNLTGLLSDVAEAAREEATMRMRTETSRAQSYSDAKAVTLIILGVFGLLLVLNTGYLGAFSSLAGQLVLAGVGAMWAFAIYGLAQLSKVRRPPRILAVSQRVVI